jgi:hypothetical protein
MSSPSKKVTTGCPPFLRTCCCCRGTCRVGMRWRGGGRRGRITGVARIRPCGAAQRSCAGAGHLPRAGAHLWTASFCWGGWLVRCGAATHADRSVTDCNRRPPSSTSASTSGLSRPVLPRRLWLVVGWVGFLSDVIGGVESLSASLRYSSESI